MTINTVPERLASKVAVLANSRLLSLSILNEVDVAELQIH